MNWSAWGIGLVSARSAGSWLTGVWVRRDGELTRVGGGSCVPGEGIVGL